MSTALRVGFLGAGKMATALASGLCRSGLTVREAIVASDVIPAAREHFAEATGSLTVDTNREVVQNADIVFVAVKPHHVRPLLIEIQPHLSERHLLVSIAAGVTLETMLGVAGRDRRLVRVMPNTPCLVGASASAYCLGGAASAEDGKLIDRMLSSVGVAVALPESLLDAVTGLSGSGPAYAFLMIEALSDGGVRMGLPRDVATKLAAQTLLGAARMVLETDQHPGVLKDAVASPGGTTIAGLHALEIGGLRGCLMNAVQAATLRSRELS
jgi:pyrroline-5-carboxylate reductase